MSSSEMMCFIHFFTIMVGDLVPHNDAVAYITLHILRLSYMQQTMAYQKYLN
jgi:hypothetical protein